MSTLLVIASLSQALESRRFRYQSEAELQDGVALVLTELQIPFTREYSLGTAGRLDFFLTNDGVALEVKTRGSRSELVRQVMRYVEDPKVQGVLVLTTRLQHHLPLQMNGKPVRVVSIPRAFV